MINKKILFIGYGEIAQLCTKHLFTRGFKITALSRTQHHSPSAAQPDQWRHICGSVFDPQIQKQITKEYFDSVVVTLTPQERSDSVYNYTYPKTISNLKKLWVSLGTQPKQLIYVSSTAVYAQNNNEYVNEVSKTSPTRFNGVRLLEAEHIAHSLAEVGTAVTCLRFSGIYGPGRYHLLKSVMQGQIMGEHYTNRIHVEDCAGIIDYLIERYMDAGWFVPVLIGSDACSEKSSMVKTWLYEQLAQQIEVEPVAQGQPVRPIGSKRCDNSLLLKSGYPLKYPHYKVGFKNIIDAFCLDIKKPR